MLGLVLKCESGKHQHKFLTFPEIVKEVQIIRFFPLENRNFKINRLREINSVAVCSVKTLTCPCQASLNFILDFEIFEELNLNQS